MEESVALTWSTMTARLRNLRFGALSSLFILVIMAVAGIVLHTRWALLGLPLLAALGFVFVLRDQKLVFAWEDRVLALWGHSDLCMGILVHTMVNHPGALKSSLKTMVAALPENADYLVPPPEQILAHRVLFWTRSALQEIRLYRSAALNLLLASLPITLWSVAHSGWPRILWGAAPLAALPLLDVAVVRLGLHGWGVRLKKIEPWDRKQVPDFSARLGALDWSRVPGRWRKKIRERIAA